MLKLVDDQLAKTRLATAFLFAAAFILPVNAEGRHLTNTDLAILLSVVLGFLFIVFLAFVFYVYIYTQNDKATHGAQYPGWGLSGQQTDDLASVAEEGLATPDQQGSASGKLAGSQGPPQQSHSAQQHTADASKDGGQDKSSLLHLASTTEGSLSTGPSQPNTPGGAPTAGATDTAAATGAGLSQAHMPRTHVPVQQDLGRADSSTSALPGPTAKAATGTSFQVSTTAVVVASEVAASESQVQSSTTQVTEHQAGSGPVPHAGVTHTAAAPAIAAAAAGQPPGKGAQVKSGSKASTPGDAVAPTASTVKKGSSQRPAATLKPAGSRPAGSNGGFRETLLSAPEPGNRQASVGGAASHDERPAVAGMSAGGAPLDTQQPQQGAGSKRSTRDSAAGSEADGAVAVGVQGGSTGGAAPSHASAKSAGVLFSQSPFGPVDPSKFGVAVSKEVQRKQQRQREREAAARQAAIREAAAEAVAAAAAGGGSPKRSSPSNKGSPGVGVPSAESQHGQEDDDDDDGLSMPMPPNAVATPQKVA